MYRPSAITISTDGDVRSPTPSPKKLLDVRDAYKAAGPIAANPSATTPPDARESNLLRRSNALLHRAEGIHTPRRYQITTT